MQNRGSDFCIFKFVVPVRYQLIGAVRLGVSSQGSGLFQGIVLPASALLLSSGELQAENAKIQKVKISTIPIRFRIL